MRVRDTTDPFVKVYLKTSGILAQAEKAFNRKRLAYNVAELQLINFYLSCKVFDQIYNGMGIIDVLLNILFPYPSNVILWRKKLLSIRS